MYTYIYVYVYTMYISVDIHYTVFPCVRAHICCVRVCLCVCARACVCVPVFFPTSRQELSAIFSGCLLFPPKQEAVLRSTLGCAYQSTYG